MIKFEFQVVGTVSISPWLVGLSYDDGDYRIGPQFRLGAVPTGGYQTITQENWRGGLAEDEYQLVL